MSSIFRSFQGDDLDTVSSPILCRQQIPIVESNAQLVYSEQKPFQEVDVTSVDNAKVLQASNQSIISATNVDENADRKQKHVRNLKNEISSLDTDKPEVSCISVASDEALISSETSTCLTSSTESGLHLSQMSDNFCLVPDSQKPAQAEIKRKKCRRRKAMFTHRKTKAQREDLRTMQELQSDLKRVDTSLGSHGTGQVQSRQDSEAEEGNSQDSLRSLDVPDPAGSFLHLSAQEIRAMQSANLLQLIANDRGKTFLKKLETTLKDGVPRNLRDALDLAGKIPLTIKMLSQNVSAKDLLIDFSQASRQD
jgi:hypothetical protein